MTKKKQEDEMRPEYDFSKAERGKFYRPLDQTKKTQSLTVEDKSKRIIDDVKKIIFELLDRLSQAQGFRSNDLWRLREDAFDDKFQSERLLLIELVNSIIQFNPNMISRRLIIEVVLYRIIGVMIDNPSIKSEYISQLDESLGNLLNYRSTRNMDIPIVNLELEGRPFQFGMVRFLPITDDDRSEPWWESIKGTLGNDIAFHCAVSYARVLAPGDLDTSMLYATSIVDDALLLLRGISFPFTLDEVVQFGVVGDVFLDRNRLYRPEKPNENIHLEPQPHWRARNGPSLRPYHLYEELLSKVEESNLTNFLELITTNQGFNPSGSEMKAKIIRGFKWIGEASKLDTVESRFAKLTFALENLIGGEAKDDNLSSSGLTAMLAERAAFLVGENQTERLKIDADVRKYYGKRSDIVHGRLVSISGDDLQKFAHLVRSVAWSSLKLIDQIKTITDLQKWVREQRYL